MPIERMMASNHLILCHLLLLLPSSFPSIRAFRNEVKLFWQSLNALWLGLKANLGPFLLCDSFKPAFQFECDSCVLYLNSNVNNLSIILRIIRKHQDKQEEKGLKVIFQPQETPDMVYSTSSTVAAAAESLQSCPTPCDPTDGSPPGSPVPELLQARTLEWVAISFSNAWKWKVKGKSLSRVRLLATSWTAAHQAPPSMGFSRQEYWSGVPLPSLISSTKDS